MLASHSVDVTRRIRRFGVLRPISMDDPDSNDETLRKSKSLLFTRCAHEGDLT